MHWCVKSLVGLAFVHSDSLHYQIYLFKRTTSDLSSKTPQQVKISSGKTERFHVHIRYTQLKIETSFIKTNENEENEKISIQVLFSEFVHRLFESSSLSKDFSTIKGIPGNTLKRLFSSI